MKQCKIENCENPVWGEGVCKYHTKSSNLKPKLAPRRHFQSKDVETINKMPAFFLSIWKKRGHFSEVSNTPLGAIPNTTFFHHILLKSVVKEAKFDEENIIILTQEEHLKVHSDMYFYNEINERRKLLKIKYNIL